MSVRPVRHRDDPVQVVRIEAVAIGGPAATGRGHRVRRCGAQDVLEQRAAHLGVVGHGLAIDRVVPVGDGPDEQVDAAQQRLADVLEHRPVARRMGPRRLPDEPGRGGEPLEVPLGGDAVAGRPGHRRRA